MGKRSTVLTGWQENVHVVTMPREDATYFDRTRRVPPGNVLWGRVPRPEVAMMEGISQQAGRTVKLLILEVCPGFSLSAEMLVEECHELGYAPGTLAHLVELAVDHRMALARFMRVYAVDGFSSEGSGQPLMMPYIGRLHHRSRGMELSTMAVLDGGLRQFHGAPPGGHVGFIFVETEGHMTGPGCCLGCNR